MNCGRQPDGDRVDERGCCPAALATEVDGVNRGTNGGRYCWTVAGTFCGGKVQGIFAMKIDSCMSCAFLHLVESEEATQFVLHPEQLQEP